jgi:polyisoprenoid-binding protein YceI
MAAEAGGTAQAGADVQALVRDGALAGRWVLDPRASRVEFRVRHFCGGGHRARLVRAARG